ncbi:MAG TPA: YiiX/YebB-like N1pC/P60 family cysteine hydrolase [Aestuariivirga sp.]|nr:YiiX/YebB-like N1pC/P60 family cysteine hydrolase [Aestuariivirga sp.]
MRRRAVLIGLSMLLVLAAGSLYATTAEVKFPPLKNGDLVFQTSTSSQSSAIFVATGNSYTHMGIIKDTPSGFVVVEAAGVVRETPLRDWVNRGLLNRVALYRDEKLTDEQSQVVLSSAEKYYGRAYDIFFSFNNQTIYCSELPYLAFGEAGIPIGRVQKVSDLNFDNALVKKIIEQRWQRHEECKAKNYDFEQCYDHILKESLVTPASIAEDKQFARIFSNYPF